jgi:hypothetical protein
MKYEIHRLQTITDAKGTKASLPTIGTPIPPALSLVGSSFILATTACHRHRS